MRWRQCSWESSCRSPFTPRRLPARHGLAGWVGTMRSLVAVFGIVALLFVLVVSGVQLAGLLEDYAPHMAFVVWTSIPGGKAADQLTNLWRHDGCSRRVHKPV